MLPSEGDVPGNPVPSSVANAVLRQLESSSIRPCVIVLEHTAAPTEQTLRTDFDHDGDAQPDCPACQPPASGLPDDAVRVTVCVELTELMPNCLAAFGFDLAGRTAQGSVTFARE
jgi:hypothetical protein